MLYVTTWSPHACANKLTTVFGFAIMRMTEKRGSLWWLAEATAVVFVVQPLAFRFNGELVHASLKLERVHPNE